MDSVGMVLCLSMIVCWVECRHQLKWTEKVSLIIICNLYVWGQSAYCMCHLSLSSLLLSPLPSLSLSVPICNYPSLPLSSLSLSLSLFLSLSHSPLPLSPLLPPSLSPSLYISTCILLCFSRARSRRAARVISLCSSQPCWQLCRLVFQISSFLGSLM